MSLYLKSTVLSGVLAAGLGLGCGGDDGEDPPFEKPDPNAPESLVLATGITSMETLTDGDDLFIVQGPQGGYHLFGTVAVTGFECGDPTDPANPDNPTTEFRVFDTADESRVDNATANRFTQGFRPIDGSTAFGVVGRTVILQITDDSQLDGHELRMEVTVTDVNGVELSDERTINAIAHPDNM